MGNPKTVGRANPLSDVRVSVAEPRVFASSLACHQPAVLPDFNERRFRVIAGESPVETRVSLYLCRDPWEALRLVLPRRSLVVIGGRRPWWPTRDETLAGKLRCAGHEVIFTETE